MAVLVADRLRDRILRGELTDGSHLPKEDELRAQLGVGKPAMREAMRILEEEGLVSIVRGNRGGAVVHTPSAANIAYSLALSLSSRGIQAGDVALALRQVEPLCAGLCARRRDRRRTIVQALRASVEAAEQAQDDPPAATRYNRAFHEALVAGCGNETLIMMGGALEELWSSHVRSWAARSDGATGKSRSADLRRSIAEHRRILELIEAGEAEQVRDVLGDHLERVQRAPTPANAARIDISVLRALWSAK